MIKISICQTTRKMLLISVKIKKKLRIGQSQLVFLMLPSQKYKFQHLIDTSPPSYGRNIVLCDTGIDIGITRKSTFYSSFLPPFLTPHFYPIILVMGGILYFAILVSISVSLVNESTFYPSFLPPVFNPSFLPSYGRNIILSDTGIDNGIATESILIPVFE